MNDRDLPRTASILERMAYEDDVRRVIRKLIVNNNEIDAKFEQLYLHGANKRDHS